jgi:hypothetical protein
MGFKTKSQRDSSYHIIMFRVQKYLHVNSWDMKVSIALKTQMKLTTFI